MSRTYTRELKEAIHKMLVLSDAPEWKRFDEYHTEDARVLRVWLDAFPSYCDMSTQQHDLADFVELGRLIVHRYQTALGRHLNEIAPKLPEAEVAKFRDEFTKPKPSYMRAHTQ